MTRTLKRFGLYFVVLSFSYFLLIISPGSVVASDIGNGKVVGKKDESVTDTKSNSTTQLKNESISINKNQIKIVGEIEYNENKIPLSLEGEILPIEKSLYHVLFGELKSISNEELKFIQLKVESENDERPIVKMLLEHNKTKELLVFQFEIDDNLFRDLKEISKVNSENFSEEELIEKTNELNRAQRNKRSHFLSLDESSQEIEESNPTSTLFNELTVPPLEEPINRNELKRLIDDLKKVGEGTWIKYSNYSLPKSLVSTEGYFKNIEYADNTHEKGNYLYGHGYKNPYGVYLIGFNTMESLIAENTDFQRIFIQHTIENAVTLKYDPETDQVQLYLKDRGLKHFNMRFAIGKLKNDNVFYSHATYGILNNPQGVNPGYLITRLVSIVPHGAPLASVWDFLEAIGDGEEKTSKLGQKYSYDPNDEEGVKNISSESGDLYIANPGDFFSVEGEVSNPNEFWSWSWRIKIRPNF